MAEGSSVRGSPAAGCCCEEGRGVGRAAWLVEVGRTPRWAGGHGSAHPCGVGDPRDAPGGLQPRGEGVGEDRQRTPAARREALPVGPGCSRLCPPVGVRAVDPGSSALGLAPGHGPSTPGSSAPRWQPPPRQMSRRLHRAHGSVCRRGTAAGPGSRGGGGAHMGRRGPISAVVPHPRPPARGCGGDTKNRSSSSSGFLHASLTAGTWAASRGTLLATRGWGRFSAAPRDHWPGGSAMALPVPWSPGEELAARRTGRRQPVRSEGIYWNYDTNTHWGRGGGQAQPRKARPPPQTLGGKAEASAPRWAPPPWGTLIWLGVRSRGAAREERAPRLR